MAIDAGVDVIDHADDMDDECIERMTCRGLLRRAEPLLPDRVLEMLGGGLGFAEAMRADLDRMLEILPKANAAGVKLVLGDDYGAVGFPHGRYADELEVTCATPASRRSTCCAGPPCTAPSSWGAGDELGRVADGYLADLLVVDGDPSRDVTVLQDPANIVGIMKGGAWHKEP